MVSATTLVLYLGYEGATLNMKCNEVCYIELI